MTKEDDGTITLLDHGYIKLIQLWGSDKSIIEAARMSTNKGFINWENDFKLLKYLYDHKHMTPFEMAGCIIEVQAPIFVFREWHRHRTQSYNELSARYTELPNLFYIPSIERIVSSSKISTNKQTSGTLEITDKRAELLQADIQSTYNESRMCYEDLLKEGIAKEIARLVIPVAQYSRMRASANLRNWLQFLTLRQASNAQWEIRQYANELNNILVSMFPKTMELFNGQS